MELLLQRWLMLSVQVRSFVSLHGTVISLLWVFFDLINFCLSVLYTHISSCAERDDVVQLNVEPG